MNPPKDDINKTNEPNTAQDLAETGAAETAQQGGKAAASEVYDEARENDGAKGERSRRFKKRDIALMIVSVFFAFLVWSYVLNAENPYREKNVRNVSVSFSGESILNNTQKLMVTGDREGILADVRVVISVPARLYSDVTASKIAVTADLSGITEAGESELQLSAKVLGYSDVSIVSVTPSTIKLNIDYIRERKLPIETVYNGTVAEGYHAFPASLEPSSINVIGAAGELSKVAKAVCEIDTLGRSVSIHDTLPIKLYDADGNLLSFDGLSGDMPYTTCVMTVLPKKTVPIDVVSSILGTDSLAEGYELKSAPSVSPSATVEIAAEQKVLDAIDSVALEPINLTGASESVLYGGVALVLPEGVTIIGETSYSVFVDIGEMQAAKTFFDLPVEMRNLGDNLETELSIGSGKAIVSGPKSVVDKIREKDVTLYVDAFGLSAGAHETAVYVELSEGYEALDKAAVPQTLTLTITQTE